MFTGEEATLGPCIEVPTVGQMGGGVSGWVRGSSAKKSRGNGRGGAENMAQIPAIQATRTRITKPAEKLSL